MNVVEVDQMNAVLALLQEIRDRLPEGGPAMPGKGRTPAPQAATRRPAAPGVYNAQRQALAAVLGQLEGWVKGAMENHTAAGHRGEPVGSECWTQFHPQDIRTIVNDAARQLGIDVFP